MTLQRKLLIMVAKMPTWIAQLPEIANCQINFHSWCTLEKRPYIKTVYIMSKKQNYSTPETCVRRSKFPCSCKYQLLLISTNFLDILEFEKILTKTWQKWIFCKNWALRIFKWPNFLQKDYQEIRKTTASCLNNFLNEQAKRKTTAISLDLPLRGVQ